MREAATLTVDPARAVGYEHGWQSWSPTACYQLTNRPPRPSTDNRRLVNYRPGHRPTDGVYRGEGLLAVDPGNGDDVHVFAAPAADGPIVVSPDVQHRERWAWHVERYGGLRASGDRLLSLDDWGPETTRRLLRRVPARPFPGDGSLP